jgi:cation diffusion facilitator family transporter
LYNGILYTKLELRNKKVYLCSKTNTIVNTNKLPQYEGWLSIIGNVLLFGLKYWAGIVTGSIALIADAWHTLTDSISSIIVVISAKISQKPADEEHPFGHGRTDLIAAIIVGVLLAVIGFDFILESIHQLRSGEGVVFGKVAIIVTIVSVVAKEALAQFAFWAYKKNGSKVLKADGWHHRTDALSSAIILGGIFLGKIWWWIDGVLGIIVALLIFYAAYEILKQSMSALIGEKPDDQLVQKVHAIAKSLNYNVCPHHFHLHDYGKHQELTFHIVLPREMILCDAHKIANAIEKQIREELNIIATIHMEPNVEGVY